MRIQKDLCPLQYPESHVLDAQRGSKKEDISKKLTKSKQSQSGDENSRGGPSRYRRHAKPPYAYAGLMVCAIWMSPEKCLTLSELHAKMEEMFLFFK